VKEYQKNISFNSDEKVLSQFDKKNPDTYAKQLATLKGIISEYEEAFMKNPLGRIIIGLSRNVIEPAADGDDVNNTPKPKKTGEGGGGSGDRGDETPDEFADREVIESFINEALSSSRPDMKNAFVDYLTIDGYVNAKKINQENFVGQDKLNAAATENIRQTRQRKVRGALTSELKGKLNESAAGRQVLIWAGITGDDDDDDDDADDDIPLAQMRKGKGGAAAAAAAADADDDDDDKPLSQMKEKGAAAAAPADDDDDDADGGDIDPMINDLIQNGLSLTENHVISLQFFLHGGEKPTMGNKFAQNGGSKEMFLAGPKDNKVVGPRLRKLYEIIHDNDGQLNELGKQVLERLPEWKEFIDMLSANRKQPAKAQRSTRSGQSGSTVDSQDDGGVDSKGKRK